MSDAPAYQQLLRTAGRDISLPDRPVVCVQGLGFVGAAMAVAVANARDEGGEPRFNVVGVELDTAPGAAKVAALNAGEFPIRSNDRSLAEAFERAHALGNLVGTTCAEVYSIADTVVVDIPLDVDFAAAPASVDFSDFRAAMRTLGSLVPSGALVLVETTVPPGTTEKVVVPEIRAALAERGLPGDCVHIAHSYERVMPGHDYLDSIVNFWRVYAGHGDAASDACEAFLSKVIHVAEFPLCRVGSPTASETGKLLENSYRAVNIAFAEEWGRYAEAVGIDLFEIIAAVRKRPTHANLRQPGFGVGGYCLTKDPLLAAIGTRELFGREDLAFDFSTRAVAVNDKMPLVTVDRLERALDHGLHGRRVLLLGVSYRPDVADTRYAPSETFVLEARRRGAEVACHDPLVSHWSELDLTVATEIPEPKGFDAVVFAVPHREYTQIDLPKWLSGSEAFVFDANDVLTAKQRADLRAAGIRAGFIGRGDPS